MDREIIEEPKVMTMNIRAAGSAFEPRQGTISDAEMRFYLRRARHLRAVAFHDAAAALRRGIVRLWRRIGRLWRRIGRAVARLQHSAAWRAPGSGNCPNC